jgi:hypothetical protein
MTCAHVQVVWPDGFEGQGPTYLGASYALKLGHSRTRFRLSGTGSAGSMNRMTLWVCPKPLALQCRMRAALVLVELRCTIANTKCLTPG